MKPAKTSAGTLADPPSRPSHCPHLKVLHPYEGELLGAILDSAQPLLITAEVLYRARDFFEANAPSRVAQYAAQDAATDAAMSAALQEMNELGRASDAGDTNAARDFQILAGIAGTQLTIVDYCWSPSGGRVEVKTNALYAISRGLSQLSDVPGYAEVAAQLDRTAFEAAVILAIESGQHADLLERCAALHRVT